MISGEKLEKLKFIKSNVIRSDHGTFHYFIDGFRAFVVDILPFES